MAKLSKTMIEVLNKAYEDIKIAKENDYPTWLMKTVSHFDWREERFSKWTGREAVAKVIAQSKENWEKHVSENYIKEYWEEHRNNIVLTRCSSETIRALEKRGYIRIIRDSTGERIGIDKVEVLKFDF